MNIRHLRYFVTVAECLSFTAAAKQLGIAQPPLSVQIRNLEKDLGSPLFLRDRRKVSLTPFGFLLLEEARELLRLAARAEGRLRDAAEGRTGELRVSHTQGALSKEVTRRTRKFLRRQRGVRLVLTREGYSEDPTSNLTGLDLRITESSEEVPGSILLEKSSLLIAVPPKHRLAEHPEIGLSDLIGECLILSPAEHRSPAEKIILELIQNQGIKISKLDGPALFADRMWQVSLGQGISVCTTSDRGAMDTICLPLSDPAAIFTIALANPASRAVALMSFLESIRA